MSVRLLFVERDPGAAWAVMTATRPIASLRFGDATIAERLGRWAGASPVGVLVRGALQDFEEEASVRAVSAPPDAGPTGTLFWDSRAVPRPGVPFPELAARPAVVEIAGRYAGLWLPPGRPLPPEPGDLPDGRSAGDRDAPRAADGDVPTVPCDGAWLDAPWTLIDLNRDVLREDLAAFHGLGVDGRPSHHRFEGQPGVHVERGHPVWVEADVDVGPGVVFDTSDGAIRLDQGVRVLGPARLIGPLHLAWDTWILGGEVGASSIGPVCKIRGEVSESVLLGWSNKSHEGHLGHALLGRWVNLGAGTSNSDLRNDYAPVRARVGQRRVDTGLVKFGATVGDHVKTGIGTLIPTGASLGAGSQIASGGFVAPYVAPLSWVTPDGARPYRFERFTAVMRAAMARRYVVPSAATIEIFRRLHAEVHGGDSA